MNYFQLIHFFCVVSYLYIAAYVVIKNHRSLLNLSCFAVIFVFCLWSFSLIFVHSPDASKQTANLFYNIGSFAWSSFASVTLWFIMVFIDNKKLLRSKLFYAALILPPALVIYNQWAGSVAADYILMPWGWAFVWSTSIWANFFFLYYLVYMTWGLSLLIWQGRKTNDPIKKKQTAIISYTAIPPLILATATDVVLPNIGINTMPNMAPDFTIIWTVGLVIAIVKYRMLEITPAMAADKIISTMSESLLLLDNQGRIILANSAANNLLSYEKNELTGKTIDQIFPEGHRDEQMRLIENGRNLLNHDYILAGKNGRDISVIFSKSLMKGTTGEVVGSCCVATDITKRKRAEEEIKAYSARLASANEELEAFSYSVSHDLRAPLRSIDGFARILLEDHADKVDADGQDYLRRVGNAALRMSSLIDALLKLSRQTRGKIHREDVDLSAMATRVMTQLKESQPERDVEFVIEDGLEANCDSKLMNVLLENLIGNAWKFTGKKNGASIEFRAMERDGKKAYFVRDNGAGFDMKYSDKLFGAFQRQHSEEEFSGTGIGLATVQRVINRHGGKIWAEGEVGKGATFCFTL